MPPPPSFTPLILALEYSSIFDIYQSYVEANSYKMSCINHNNKQDTDIISISGKICRWKGGTDPIHL